MVFNLIDIDLLKLPRKTTPFYALVAFREKRSLILVTSFLVVYFSFCLAHLALQIIVEKITQPKERKTKIEVTKICDEPGINGKTDII